MSSDNLPPPADMKIRRQVREKLAEIKAYIDEQRGNDPDDETGWKVLQEIFRDLFFIRRYPFSGKQVRGLNKNYRQRRVGASYIIYYYTTDDAARIYVIDLRHGAQRPLKPSTLRKYKSDIPEE